MVQLMLSLLSLAMLSIFSTLQLLFFFVFVKWSYNFWQHRSHPILQSHHVPTILAFLPSTFLVKAMLFATEITAALTTGPLFRLKSIKSSRYSPFVLSFLLLIVAAFASAAIVLLRFVETNKEESGLCASMCVVRMWIFVHEYKVCFVLFRFGRDTKFMFLHCAQRQAYHVFTLVGIEYDDEYVRQFKACHLTDTKRLSKVVCGTMTFIFVALVFVEFRYFHTKIKISLLNAKKYFMIIDHRFLNGVSSIFRGRRIFGIILEEKCSFSLEHEKFCTFLKKKHNFSF